MMPGKCLLVFVGVLFFWGNLVSYWLFHNIVATILFLVVLLFTSARRTMMMIAFTTSKLLHMYVCVLYMFRVNRCLNKHKKGATNYSLS